ncbi:hydroxycarboxylic acid receptor 3-like [Colossoma macropomum]|uniref:hydroxycarboxylic acid receptor 3-like n=1 Tax=Colossoma macropomum TaxID=42526 RepID=UPI0018651447|nr:hydroxycarboxylic acid receptor 3-like [Colossoma macropomum]
MSSSNNNTHCGLSPQILVASILHPVLIVELLLGLPGNLMALWVFCRHLQSWTPNVVFLLNLVLADFLLLVSLPFRIIYLQKGEDWVFGDAWCRINLFMLAVNRSASIGFMTAVAVDRYFKVVHPHHTVNFISSQQAAGIACFIWAVVVSLRFPLLLTNSLLSKKNNVSICRSFRSYKQPPLGIWLHFMVYIGEFFLLLVVLVFCSVRIICSLRHRQMNKKKVKRAICTVLVIAGVFLTCFFPSIATGLTVLYLKKLGNEYCRAYRLCSELFGLSIGFTYLNSALDPLIYCFSSSMFRNEVKRAINWFGLVELQLSHHGTTVSTRDS